MATEPERSGSWRLLGPVRLVADGREIDLGPAKQRCVVAVLLMTPGTSVPVDTLVDRVWGERPPRAGNAVAPYVARLRRAVAAAGDDPAMLRFAAGGYRLDCAADRVDLHRARERAAAARAAQRAGDDERAAELLRQALTGWEPVALAGLPGEWAARMRDTLGRERLELLAEYAEAELRRGRPESVLDDVRTAVAEHPTAERLVAALMNALAGSGRTAEALDCYARLRAAVADQFGAEPSAALQQLHVALLRDGAATPAVRLPDRRTGPAQLPADVAAFAGRDEELRRMDELLADHDETAEKEEAAVIAVVSGTAGVGKTTLAVHWAHRVRHRFPDGQLFVNLGGFGPSDLAVPPDEALRGFLEALGVPGERVPRDLAARAAMFRTLVADRRILIVIDNARDADQVRPLIPGTPGSVAVVTSRDRLLSLVAIEAARPLFLGLLSVADARKLVLRRLGAARVAAEPVAVERLVAACARLPIALAIVAARAVARPDLPLSALADQLAATSGRLDVLDGDDASSDVRAVFSWSYRRLSPAAARLFRLLGLHPGPSFAISAAASLAGDSPARAAGILDELVRAHLVVATTSGRYQLHDLLRAYAAGLVTATDDEAGRTAALHRLLDHYLHGAARATCLIHSPSAITPPPAQPGTTVDELPDSAAALAWLIAEDPVLVNLIRLAGPAGFDRYVWQLVRSRDMFAVRQGRWSDLVTLQHIGLDAARRAGDRAAEAMGLRGLARAHIQLGDHDEAHRHCLSAVRLFRELGDRISEAQTHHLLAELFDRRGDHRTALRHAQQALVLYEAADDLPGTARALNATGWCLAVLGDQQLAIDHCARALALFRAIGDRDGEAATHGSLGYAHEHLGRLAAAVTHYEQAIRLCRELGELYYQADTLTHLGDTHRAAGNHPAARAAWHEALRILDELGHPAAGDVRTRLAGLVRTD